MTLTLRATLLASMMALASPAALAEEVTLTYSNWLPAGHVINEVGLKPFFADVEKVTEGRVRIETLPATVGSAVSQYDVVSEGLADITFVIMGYTPGRFPLSEVVELPFIGSDPGAVSVAFWHVYQDELAKHNEFAGTVPLSLFVASSSNIATRDKPIASLASLQGLKMRNPLASFVPAAEKLGVVPVNKPVSEIYELASTGVIDGAFVPLDSLASFRLQDVLHYYTLVEGGILSPAMGLFINQESWSRIAPADQAAIMSIAGEKLSRAVGGGYRDSDLKVISKLEGTDGWHLTRADDALMSELHQRLDFMREEWVKKAEKLGVENPGSIIERIVSEAEKQSK